MSHYDEFRGMFGERPPEEKLANFRSESKRLLAYIHGYSWLILNLIEERKPPDLPDDFGEWCQNVVKGVEELQDLIDALTDWKHRSILQEEKTKHDKAFGEMLWKNDQQGLPELQNYTSLGDAVEKTAKRLNLLLLSPEIKVDDSFWHPGGLVHFRSTERRALIGAQTSPRGHRSLGYVVTLVWLKDKRNVQWQEYEGITPSLEEAVTVLHLWLVKEQELLLIQQKYPWMSGGRFQSNS